jgi:hypothetical protein
MSKNLNTIINAAPAGIDGSSAYQVAVSNGFTGDQTTWLASPERDKRLAACDWTQTLDAPANKEAWAAYRQSLRARPPSLVFLAAMDINRLKDYLITTAEQGEDHQAAATARQ